LEAGAGEVAMGRPGWGDVEEANAGPRAVPFH